MKHYVYLSAGFFGFSNLGGITYFHHVRELLGAQLAELGIEAEFITVKTLPTASIRRRSGSLLETIAATALDEDAPIHLIGHSTGGLDTRLLVTPGAALMADKLENGRDLESYARRVQTVITVSTPHLGTPMANYFNGLFGQNLLWAMSLATIYTLRFGRLPLGALFMLMGVVTRIDRIRGLQHTILNQFYQGLFADFDDDRKGAISEFLEQIRTDRSAVGQLTPGAIDLFNASTTDRPGVRYGCVVTRARGLNYGAFRRAGLDPYAHASHAVFRMLQLMSAQSAPMPNPPTHQSVALVHAYGELPSRRDSDGVVPTLSQLWGEVIHAARADHLDVCGHFNQPSHDPPHIDWFRSGSEFRRPEFEALWSDVAAFIARPDMRG